MKLLRELQEGMADGLEQLPQFMKHATSGNWSDAIDILEQHTASIVSVYLSRLRSDLGGQALQEFLERWKGHRGITERRILTNIRLSDHQKKVLTKIQAASDEHDAYNDVSVGEINTIAARDTLDKIGLIQVDQDQETAVLTQQGMETMKSENLLDDMGELTDEAQQYIYDDADQQQEPQPGVAPGAQPPGPMGQQDMGGQPGGMDQGQPEPNLDFSESVIVESAGTGLTQSEHRDVRAFIEGTMEWYDMSETAQDKLFGVWQEEMPYGVAKARSGDPDQWIADRMQSEIEDIEKKGHRQDGFRFAKRTYRDPIDEYIENLFK